MDAVSGIEGDYLRRPTIGVIPEYQRKGIGKALVLRLMEKSKRENLPPLLGSVRVLKNVELYKKWGGEILKVVQKDGLDVYYMVFKHEKVLKT